MKVERKIASDESRIPRRNAGHQAEIGRDPKSEDAQMQIDEGHAAGEAGDEARDALLGGRLGLLPFPPTADRLDIPLKSRRKR
jgi:hypothetical protein